MIETDNVYDEELLKVSQELDILILKFMKERHKKSDTVLQKDMFR